MPTKQVSVSEFKARCTTLLREMGSNHTRLEVTNRGRVIAVVSPPVSETPESSAAWLGSLRGSVTRYDGPFEPVTDSNAWHANRD
jgi:hypothetical protein